MDDNRMVSTKSLNGVGFPKWHQLCDEDKERFKRVMVKDVPFENLTEEQKDSVKKQFPGFSKEEIDSLTCSLDYSDMWGKCMWFVRKR